MLVTFYSKAAADVVMLGHHAIPLFACLAKDPGERGVFTPAEIPAAIRLLQGAIQQSPTLSELEQQQLDTAESASIPDPQVSLGQRAYPLLKMLEKALQMNEPVLWEIAS